MDGDTTFGAWLKSRRRHLDMTQKGLAHQVGCSVGTIRKMEADERRPSRQLKLSQAGGASGGRVSSRAVRTERRVGIAKNAIFSAIVALGRALKLQVIAEGVENTSQLEYLKSIGCTIYQGFLQSKPVTAKAFEALLLKQK